MKKLGVHRLGLLVGIGILLILSACDRTPEGYIEILSSFEPLDYQDQPISNERIEELRRDIDRYSKVVEEKITGAASLASAYKLLGGEYQKFGMHRLALAAFELAIEIESNNPLLLFQAGVAAGNWAASAPPTAADEFYDLSKHYYERVLSLDPFFHQALYGLAVLFTFQYDEPQNAEDLVDRYLRVRSQDTRALFLKARLLAARGEISQSAALYGQIVRISTDQNEKNQALLNQRILLDSE